MKVNFKRVATAALAVAMSLSLNVPAFAAGNGGNKSLTVTGDTLDNKKVYALENNMEVIDFVAKTPEAIGVVGVNWLTNRSDSTRLSFRDEIRVMSVSADDEARADNSYKPYQYYLYYDNYPLARPIYILLNDPRNGLSWGFSNFMQGDRGQRIILKAGLLPEILRSYISINVNEE